MKPLNLDFRGKFLFTLLLPYMLLLGKFPGKFVYAKIFIIVLPYVFIFTEKKYKEFVIFVSYLVTIYFLNIVFSKYFIIRGFISFIFRMLVMFAFVFAPVIVMGRYSLISTPASDLIFSLKRMKVPDTIVIPISVMFRFFYTLVEDFSLIKDTMKLRGFNGKMFIFHPIKMAEYIMVSLLMGMLRTASDVAVSAMTKGLIPGEERSSISNAKLRLRDYIFLTVQLFLVIIYIRGKYA